MSDFYQNCFQNKTYICITEKKKNVFAIYLAKGLCLINIELSWESKIKWFVPNLCKRFHSLHCRRINLGLANKRYSVDSKIKFYFCCHIQKEKREQGENKFKICKRERSQEIMFTFVIRKDKSSFAQPSLICRNQQFLVFYTIPISGQKTNFSFEFPVCALAFYGGMLKTPLLIPRAYISRPSKIGLKKGC